MVHIIDMLMRAKVGFEIKSVIIIYSFIDIQEDRLL